MMRFRVLATDYDGTLASQGRVSPEVIAALERFGQSGRVLVLVTGRELGELLGVFPEIGLFDRVVAENGGLLYCPKTRKQHVLGEPPPSAFVQALVARGVAPLSVGRSIVATFTPHEAVVLDTIRELGLELQVIFNKGAVMVLPAGVNKATGLAVALDDLQLSMRNVVAIGDAENDHAMLRSAEFGIAVDNALPSLKREADYVSARPHGDAVVEAMEAMLRDDLAQWSSQRPPRRALQLGTLHDGTPLSTNETYPALWVGGDVGTRLTQYLGTLLEQLDDHGYQACILDFDGSFAHAQAILTLGSTARPATVEEVLAALTDTPNECVAVDLAGHDGPARDAFVASLLHACLKLRHTIGRPHWFICSSIPEASARDLLSTIGGKSAFGVILAGAGLSSFAMRGDEVSHSEIMLGRRALGRKGDRDPVVRDSSQRDEATLRSRQFADGVAFRPRNVGTDP